ncbi:MAG: autotransporter-associated beta strand repeat-containing protein, partial [Gammaproteobacteria bacterium]|nr:autotransporter-associated beta strand repeat-containing protein [Gammaproteobacteria bacterium]
TMGAGRTITLLGDTSNTSVLSFGTVNMTAAALTLTVSRTQGSGASLNIGTLDLNTSGTGGTAGIITGNGLVEVGVIKSTTAAQAFTYSGTGTLTINGLATYEGLTTISGAGTVKLGAGGNLSSTSALTMTSGTFDLNGRNQTTGTLTLTSPATITNTSGTASTFTATNIAASTGHLSGNLSGNFTLTGAAAAMSGTYTNTGNLIFNNAGTGAFTVSGTVLNTGNVTFNANNTLALTVSAPYFNPTGLVTNSGTGTGITTISGNIGANVTGVTQNSATSQLTLSGVNMYAGPTNVMAGTLLITRQSALYNNNPTSWTASSLIVNTGATLALNVGGAGEFTSSDLDTLLALGGATTGFMNGSFVALDTTNAVGGNFIHSGVISNPNGGTNVLGLIKRGTGILTLSGANTYSGGTLVSAGTLSISSDDNLGAVTSALTLASGTTLRITGTSNTTWNTSRTLNMPGAVTFDIADVANTYTLGIPSLTLNGALTKTGAGTLALGGTVTSASNIVITGGVLNPTGTVTTGAGTTSIGTSASSNGVLRLLTGANYSTTTFSIGAAAGGFGSLVIDGGTVATTTATTAAGIVFGTSGYGGIFLSDGSLSTRRLESGTGTAATSISVLQVSGGTLTNTEYLLFRNTHWDFTVTGGQVLHNAASNNLALGFQGTANAYGAMTVAGGLVNNTGRNVSFGESNSASALATASLNLNAGTLLTNQILVYLAAASATTAYVNFNGGTLQAATNTATFIGTTGSGGTSSITAYVNGAFGSFAGGAVIDTNGFNTTIPIGLIAPTGDGVSAIPLTSGGSGYIGAPFVEITGGGGTGASAYAVTDTDPSSGTFGLVTSI